MSRQLRELEYAYLTVLERALNECADGRWGLFGHNEHLRYYEAPAELGELRELAETINRLRARAGDERFPLHDAFEAARGPAAANDPGEPKQARAWLKRLAEA